MPIIQFESADDNINLPKPSKRYVPSWYAHAEAFLDKEPAIKNCIPFLDSFLTGYTAELWEDIEVVQKVHGPELRYDKNIFPPIDVRQNKFSYPMPCPEGYSDTNFVWNNPYLIKTPLDYSVLITQPLNQYSLPTFTLSAVIDTDKDLLSEGRIPFFVKQGFEGIIKKGTPIFQIIPFKREVWDSERNSDLQKDNESRVNKVAEFGSGWYKKHLWTKKEYN
jgi:hypothetical protein